MRELRSLALRDSIGGRVTMREVMRVEFWIGLVGRRDIPPSWAEACVMVRRR